MGRRLKASDPTKRRSVQAGEVQVSRLAHPAIWATAIELARGEVKRIRVITATHVEVATSGLDRETPPR